MSGDSDAVSIFKSLPDLFKLAVSIEKDTYPGRLNAITTLLALILTAVMSAGPSLLELAGNLALAWRSGASQMADSPGFDAWVLLWWFLFMAFCMLMTTAHHIVTEKMLQQGSSKPVSTKGGRSKQKKSKRS